jgi:hypothetical protein
LQLEELKATATEDEVAAEKAAKTATVSSYEHRRPACGPFLDHLSDERIVLEAPTACSCCGSDRIVKMGQDIPEALEVIPGQWKVIQTVREKVTCQSCDRISQLPAHDISPIALEAVKKIDAIFEIERRINALDSANRLDARHRLVRPLGRAAARLDAGRAATMSMRNPVAMAIA